MVLLGTIRSVVSWPGQARASPCFFFLARVRTLGPSLLFSPTVERTNGTCKEHVDKHTIMDHNNNGNQKPMPCASFDISDSGTWEDEDAVLLGSRRGPLGPGKKRVSLINVLPWLTSCLLASWTAYLLWSSSNACASAGGLYCKLANIHTPSVSTGHFSLIYAFIDCSTC